MPRHTPEDGDRHCRSSHDDTDLDRHPDNLLPAGVAVLRIEGGLFFANIEAVRREIRTHAAMPGIHAVVLDAETIPFVNVYQPKLGLAYHYAGDVLGASIQVLSQNVLQASNALSWAHDVAFGLTDRRRGRLVR